MLRPLYIALIELKRYLADRGDLAFSIALPIVLFGLMYGVFQGETSFRGTAHVVDLDGGPHAVELMARLGDQEGLTVKRYSPQEADDALERSAILTAVVIPAGFSAALETGQPAELTFKQRGSGGDEGQIVAAIVQGVAERLAGEVRVRRRVAAALDGSGVTPGEIDATMASLFARVRAEPPVSVDTTVVGGGNDEIDRLMPGIVVMFLLFAVTLGAQTLVEERRIGTLERLLTTRLSIDQLFLGKFLAGVSRATLQAAILISLAFAALGVGGFWAYIQMLFYSVLVAAAVSAIGLVIGALARTRDQAAWTAVFFTMFMTVFGGTFFDLAEGSIMEVVSRFTLNRYAIDGMERILDGGTGDFQGMDLVVLASVALLGLIAGRLAFRASQGGR